MSSTVGTSVTYTESGNLGAALGIYYDKVFLERAKYELRHDFGADVKNVPLNTGPVVHFTRFTPLAISTTALTEATNPSAVNLTAVSISSALTEYGAFVTVGSLFSLTTLDVGLKEHVSVMGQNAGETIDTLIRAELSANATELTVTTAATLTDVHTTDILTGLEIRTVVKKLKQNRAPRFPGATYRAVIGPEAAMDLMGNSEWLDAHRYTTSDAIERGVVGKLHGVEFVESNNNLITLSAGFSTSATNIANLYSSFFFGQHAYAVINLGSTTGPRIYVKNPGPNSTDNPLELFSTVGWRQPFAVKVLNSNWVFRLKTGATGGFNAS